MPCSSPFAHGRGEPLWSPCSGQYRCITLVLSFASRVPCGRPRGEERGVVVEKVEKLSPLFVDNWLTSVILWKRWKTCPQYLWITFQRVMDMWKVWKSYPHCMWITDSCGSPVESVEKLFITSDSPKSARPREAGWLDECPPEILRCAQDDSQASCHPERSEGSLVDLGGITRSITVVDTSKEVKKVKRNRVIHIVCG
jgi:hypothetical protein